MAAAFVNRTRPVRTMVYAISHREFLIKPNTVFGGFLRFAIDALYVVLLYCTYVHLCLSQLFRYGGRPLR